MQRFLYTRTGKILRFFWALLLAYTIYAYVTVTENPDWVGLTLMVVALVIVVRPSLFAVWKKPSDNNGLGSFGSSDPKQGIASKGQQIVSILLVIFVGYIAFLQINTENIIGWVAMICLAMCIFIAFSSLRKLVQRISSP